MMAAMTAVVAAAMAMTMGCDGNGGNVDNGSYVTYKMFLDYMVERFMSTYVFRR